MKLFFSFVLSLFLLQPLIAMEQEEKEDRSLTTSSFSETTKEELTVEEAKIASLYDSAKQGKKVKYPTLHSKQKTPNQGQNVLVKLNQENARIEKRIEELKGVYSADASNETEELIIKQSEITSQINVFEDLQKRSEKKLMVEQAKASMQPDQEKQQLLAEQSKVLQPDVKIIPENLQQEPSHVEKVVEQSKISDAEVTLAKLKQTGEEIRKKIEQLDKSPRTPEGFDQRASLNVELYKIEEKLSLPPQKTSDEEGDEGYSSETDSEDDDTSEISTIETESTKVEEEKLSEKQQEVMQERTEQLLVDKEFQTTQTDSEEIERLKLLAQEIKIKKEKEEEENIKALVDITTQITKITKEADNAYYRTLKWSSFTLAGLSSTFLSWKYGCQKKVTYPLGIASFLTFLKATQSAIVYRQTTKTLHELTEERNKKFKNVNLK